MDSSSFRTLSFLSFGTVYSLHVPVGARSVPLSTCTVPKSEEAPLPLRRSTLCLFLFQIAILSIVFSGRKSR